ncbi:uncharacterized protein Fot_03994 [Forsythia ovata]|uniref:BED-type domain-containing protein n=1 Tax=Forsythia ovata TaxID=205694 RepID=A0ABD1XC57_9LAMI
MDPLLEEQSTNETDDEIPLESENVNMQQSGKGHKGHKMSDMWAHFNVKIDGNEECIYCRQVYKHQSKGGTGTLRNHINGFCKKYPYMFQNKKQKTLTYDNSKHDEVLEGVSNSGQLVMLTQNRTYY